MISRTKGENWDGTDFKMEVGTRCSEYSEWTLNKVVNQFVLSQLKI